MNRRKEASVSLTTTEQRGFPTVATVPGVVHELAWFALGAAVAFLVPYLGVSVLDLQHDVYYLVYFTVTLALLGSWARIEHVDVRAAFRRQWIWSVAIGVVVAPSSSPTSSGRRDRRALRRVLRLRDPLARRRATAWSTSLLLTAFPCVVAYRCSADASAASAVERATPRSRCR